MELVILRDILSWALIIIGGIAVVTGALGDCALSGFLLASSCRGRH